MTPILEKLVFIHLFLVCCFKSNTATNLTQFNKDLVPENVFCQEKEFGATSQIECASRCLLLTNYSNCSAVIFEMLTTLGNCVCGRSNCVDSGFSNNSMEILVNVKCPDFHSGLHDFLLFMTDL